MRTNTYTMSGTHLPPLQVETPEGRVLARLDRVQRSENDKRSAARLPAIRVAVAQRGKSGRAPAATRGDPPQAPHPQQPQRRMEKAWKGELLSSGGWVDYADVAPRTLRRQAAKQRLCFAVALHSDGSPANTDLDLDTLCQIMHAHRTHTDTTARELKFFSAHPSPWRRGGHSDFFRCMLGEPPIRRHVVLQAHRARSRDGGARDRLLLLHETHLLRRASRHPNIVSFLGTYDFPSARGNQTCIVLEHCRYGSLHDILHVSSRNHPRPSKRISWSRRLRIMRDAASALAYLHTLGVVCFDLNSKRLLIDGRGNVKLSGFGRARCRNNQDRDRVLGEEFLHQHHLEIPKFLGWMAPECLGVNEEVINESTTVYSFGVVMWEMATYCKPYDDIKADGMMWAFQIIDRIQRAFDSNSEPLERPTLAQAQGPLPADYMELMYACMALQWQDRPEAERVRSQLDEIYQTTSKREEWLVEPSRREEWLVEPATEPELEPATF